MTFAESETRLRRFLRDPNGLIWSSADLMTYFNDAQVELALKTGSLVRVENHHYPPEYNNSYTYDWERDYLEGDRFQCFMVNQPSGDIMTAIWETSYWMSAQQTEEDNYTYSQPWEWHYCSQAEPPLVLLHRKFDRMLHIAYDKDSLIPTTKREIDTNDPFNRTRQGVPTHYYRPDDYLNSIIPYPVPSAAVVNITDETEIFVDDGGIVSSDETILDEEDIGIMTDIIVSDDAFLMVYTAQPNEIVETTNEPDFPAFFTKYLEYATLERAYGADTDGYIPTLRDYWKLRKEIGIKALLRFKRMMLTDRDYRMGGQDRVMMKSRLRLPDGYPAI